MLKLVVIEWEDAGEVARHDPSIDFKPFMMTTAGFIVRQNKDRVILASIIPHDREECSITVIPRGVIREIHYCPEYTPGQGFKKKGKHKPTKK